MSDVTNCKNALKYAGSLAYKVGRFSFTDETFKRISTL